MPFSASTWSGLKRVGSVVDSGFSWFDDSPLLKKRSPARKGIVQTQAPQDRQEPVTSEITKYCVVVWLAVQIVLPLRYLAYPGNPRWTDDGRLFAWWGNCHEKHTELKLSLLQSDRQIIWSVDPKSQFPVPLRVIYSDQELERQNLADGMLQDIILTNDDDIMNMRIKAANLSNEDVSRLDAASLIIAKLQLTDFELHEMCRRPELLRQYCVYVADTLGQIVPRRPQVRVELLASLNHRNWATMIPEASELSQERFSLEPFAWIAPLSEPLPTADERLAFYRDHHGDWENGSFESAPAGDKPKESEAVLAPGISDQDEEWFQTSYPATPGESSSE